LWRKRTCWQDVTQSWLTDFVDFSTTVEQVTLENLMLLPSQERAKKLYFEIRKDDES